MKVSRSFVWVDNSIDTSANSSGWKLQNMPHFDPAPFYKMFLMIHDTLEHHPDDGTELFYEMMAFGASYFIRVFGNWSHFTEYRDGKGYKTQYNDIIFFLGEHSWLIKPCDEPHHPDLSHAMARCHEYLKNDYENSPKYQEYLDALNMSFRWISKGYARAKARWEGHTNHEVCAMFENMEAAAKRVTGSVFRTYASHGDTLVITFDTETLKFTVDHNMKSRNYSRGGIKKAIHGILEFVENNRSPIHA